MVLKNRKEQTTQNYYKSDINFKIFNTDINLSVLKSVKIWLNDRLELKFSKLVISHSSPCLSIVMTAAIFQILGKYAWLKDILNKIVNGFARNRCAVFY